MNSFGRIFRISIYGESHGEETGILIHGIPPGLEICEDDFSRDLMRRRSSKPGTTERREQDTPFIKSGVYEAKATGAPLLISFKNSDTRSSDYKKFKDIPRPGHADLTAAIKYSGFNDPRGGGHFSGRITLGIVAAGIIAKKIIAPVKLNAELISVLGSENIEDTVKNIRQQKDSAGGIVECRGLNIPAGLGEPFFDSAESLISHIIFSIPGVKGIEFGRGFKSTEISGFENNDQIKNCNGTTLTNNSGGINGGITNSNPLEFRVAFKPTPSVAKKQKSFNLKEKRETDLQIEGRHDACYALRTPVIVESAAACVLADLMLLRQTQVY